MIRPIPSWVPCGCANALGHFGGHDAYHCRTCADDRSDHRPPDIPYLIPACLGDPPTPAG